MRETTRKQTRRAFTIVELLVVIGIIAVLASLLLPAFSSALQRAKETQCVSNFKQIGLMTELYASDNNRRFPPPVVSEWDTNANLQLPKLVTVALGGRDPRAGHFQRTFPWAVNRPFYAYQGNGSVFQCPMDKGHQAYPSWPICSGDGSPQNPFHEVAKPSLWQTVGCSYEYNAGPRAPWDPQRSPPLPRSTKLPRVRGLPRREVEDVKLPDRFIFMTEPTARPTPRAIGPGVVVWRWAQWHRNKGKKDFVDPTIAPAAFWSPVLYFDGHAEFHNFSRSVMTDPFYPFEETYHWRWYDPSGTNTVAQP